MRTGRIRRKFVEVEEGTAQGQMMFWDATLEKWVHTEITELFWNDTNKGIGIYGDIYTDRWLENNSNTFVGVGVAGGDALAHASGTEGYFNTAVGNSTIYNNTSGEFNTVFGCSAGQSNTTGSYNTIVGGSAFLLNTGSSNVVLGYNAGLRQTTASNLLIIDNQDRGSIANELAKSLIYGVFDADPANQTLRFNSKLGINCSPVGTLHVLNEEDNANVAIFYLEGKRPTPTNNDTIYIYYRMNNAAPASFEYARTTITADDITTGEEEGSLLFEVARAGTLETVLKMSPTEIVLNEPGADRDFRVEAFGVPNAISLNGADGAVTMAGAVTVNSLYIEDTDSAFKGRIEFVGTAMTVNRDLNIDLKDGTRTLTMLGSLEVEANSWINQDLSTDSTTAQLGALAVTGALTANTYNGLTQTISVPGTWYITDGTSQLLVSAGCDIDQNLSTASSPGFVSITTSGDITSTGGNIYVFSNITHYGDTDTYLAFLTDRISCVCGNKNMFDMQYGIVPALRYIKFNPSAEDIDTQFSGATVVPLLYINAGIDKVGINDSTPSYLLDVNGTFRAVGNSLIGGTLGVTGLVTGPAGSTFGGNKVPKKLYVSAQLFIGTAALSNPAVSYELDPTDYVIAYFRIPDYIDDSQDTKITFTVATDTEDATDLLIYVGSWATDGTDDGDPYDVENGTETNFGTTLAGCLTKYTYTLAAANYSIGDLIGFVFWNNEGAAIMKVFDCVFEMVAKDS